MRAPSVDTGTALRLARIAALVVGCLLFLHACERTRRVIPADVWLELAIAAALGVGAMVVAWFEIARAEELEEEDLELAADEARPAEAPNECRIESEGRTVRARIAKSGNLVLHGQDHDGFHPGHEWSWTFRPDTFPAIRSALGGDRETDLIELLDDVVLGAGPEIRDDPGAWLRAHGIAAAYREKGDHPSRVTTKLPIFRVGMRRVPEAERAAALPRGRAARAADEAAPERTRARTPRETVAARADGSGVPSRRAASAPASQRSAQITESRRSNRATESSRSAQPTESRRSTQAIPSPQSAQPTQSRRSTQATESPQSAQPTESRRSTQATQSWRSTKATESPQSALVAESRQSAPVTRSRRAAVEPESADDRPALPRRSRTTDAPQRAATRRTRSANDAEEPASDRRTPERAARRTRHLDAPPSVPVDPIAPERNGRPSAADLPSRDRGAASQRRHTPAASTPSAAPPKRMPAAAVAYEAAADRGVPARRRPAAHEAALENRHSSEAPERSYPPPPERRAHRYR
ncbi:hypothetical protein ABZ540_01385 [Nocardia xishanensis]|uniref:hypothetical protein n=1 Tax=Nocardia xishanensis TaxID=238964 RepID=UPI0033D9E82D